MSATLRVVRCVEPNDASAFLSRARAALNRGDTIAAGCLLREAIRCQAYAECSWWGCLPLGASDRTPPFVLVKSLRNAGHCPGDAFEAVAEMIGLANAAAHCQPVDAGLLAGSISLFPLFCESPCGVEGGAA